MHKRLDPKLDIVFKLLFGGPDSQEILISLLTAVIRPSVPIKSVTVLNPEIPGELATDRGIRLDVHVLLEDGGHVDVEMQSKSRGGIRKRALFYGSRLYDTQLHRGFEYKVLETNDHEILCDQLELHLVELPKLPEARSTEGLQEGKLVDWGRFLKADSDQELEELAMRDPLLRKAKDGLDLLSANPAVQRMALAREDALKMYECELQEREARGEAKAAAASVIQVLEARGIAVPEESRLRILACSDL